MGKHKKFSFMQALLLVTALLILVTGTITSCGSKSENASSATRTIVDMAGNTITVPSTINRIVITCQGGAAQEIAALGGAAKIVGQPSMQKFTTFMKMYPAFKDVPDVGSFDNVNIEDLLKLKPDVVVASVTSTVGNKKITDSGIPVVTVYTGKNNDTSGNEKEFKMIGQLLNNTKQADELVKFWDQQLQVIQERVNDISPADKKQVYYVLGAVTHTNGGPLWGQALITTAGGVNVAQDLGTVKDIDIEQVIKWNPDVMILSSNEGKFVSISDIQNNAQLQDINAVKDNQIYLCPVGTFWWDRPAPEAILGITWLAKTLYPDKFKDVDLGKLSKDFYKKFYDYNLSDTEFQAFLSPTS